MKNKKHRRKYDDENNDNNDGGAIYFTELGKRLFSSLPTPPPAVMDALRKAAKEHRERQKAR
jgi:hypothetical protein